MKCSKEDVIRCSKVASSSFEAARLLGINQKTYKKYAMELGCYWTNQHGAGLHRQSAIAQNCIVNENCFDHLSNTAAYYIGFIAADGIISGCTLTIHLAEKDQKQLTKICKFMECPITYITKYQAKYNGKSFPAVSFKVTSKHVIEELEKYNIYQRKSYLNNDMFSVVPDKYKSAWLAGYIDGDGCISYNNGVEIISNKSTVISIHNYYNSRYGIKYSELKTRNKITYYLKYHRVEDANKIIENYLNSCHIQMERKKIIAYAIYGKYCLKKQNKITREATKTKNESNVFHKASKRECRRPDRQTLLEEISVLPFTKIGEKYGVSDNAVRKWCKYYNLPYRKKDMNIN